MKSPCICPLVLRRCQKLSPKCPASNLRLTHHFIFFLFSATSLWHLQSKLLTQYVLNLAKYDQNYDIRDRARFIRQLIVPTEKSGALSKYAKKLFLAQKPAPILESSFKGKA